MLFKELPDDLNPGKVNLTPVGHASYFIVPCEACGEFCPRRIVLACGHLLCSRCCVTYETTDEANIHCAICRTRSAGEIDELAEVTLRRLMFACSCGFQGTLQEIKQHIVEGDSGDDRHAKDLNREPKPIGAENAVNLLREELRSLTIANSPVGLATKAYFCLELQTKIDIHRATKGYLETGSVDWTAAGYPVRFSCILRLYDGKSFLVPFIATRNNEPSLSSWPMKKTITFELYNLKGESVKRSTVATFSNDKPVLNSFSIACNPARGHGPSQFYSVDILTAPGANILCEGHACFSVEFKDLVNGAGPNTKEQEKFAQSSSSQWFHHPAEITEK